MATQTLVAGSFPSLSTPKIGIYNATTAAEVVAADTASVVGVADAGIYSIDLTDVSAGRYMVIVFDGTTPMSRDFVTLTLATATFYAEGIYDLAAQVNAEVVDVLTTDTFAELAAVPAATSSLKDKLTWLFMWARNKVTQTSTTSTLYADDETTAVATSTVSDDSTTFTGGEMT